MTGGFAHNQKIAATYGISHTCGFFAYKFTMHDGNTPETPAINDL